MPAPPGCIWVILIERPCSCVSPGEPGDTAARATRLGAGTDTALPIPQNGRKKKHKKTHKQTGNSVRPRLFLTTAAVPLLVQDVAPSP